MNGNVSRRDFLKAGAATAAAVSAVPAVRAVASEEAKTLVPTRVLGRTGVKVTMLNQGGAISGLTDRHLNVLKEEGVRYIDTADCYSNSEQVIGKWLKEQDRKEFFIVSKDHPRSAEEWVGMLDKRLEALQTDQLDAFFIHCFGDEEYHAHDFKSWPMSKEWADAADRMKKSGKTRFVGFSTHCVPIETRCELLENAARGGWVDAIMVASNPALVKSNDQFNRALDACHKAGIGLVCMKENKTAPETAKSAVPEFESLGLNAYTAVLSAVWTDERFSSVCSHMDNITKLKENAAAAKRFKPLKEDQLGAVIDYIQRNTHNYCAGCDGSCRIAGKTNADLNTIARYLSYYEEEGDHAKARGLFAALSPEARNLDNIDVEAASRACVSRLNFARIVRHAKQHLA